MALKNYISRINKYKSFGISIQISQAIVDFIKHLIYTNKIKEESFLNKPFAWIIKRKDQKVQKYLERKYLYILKKYNVEKIKKNEMPEKIIWVMWLQGFNDAPDLVQETYKSICTNKGEYSVITLDKNNYNDYVSIPKHIKEKHESGKISFAHYSDYIRIAILADYGGVWLDSTVYLFDRLPTKYLEFSQYHAKGIDYFPFSYLYLDSHKWESYFLCGRKGTAFYAYLRECLDAYWTENDFPVDYLFLNHFSKLGREKNSTFKQEWEDIPNNNCKIETLYRKLEEKWDCNDFNKIYGETKLFKLNHRHDIKKVDYQGNLTNYGYLTMILEDK